MVGVQRIEKLSDVERIQFEDGMAAVTVPADLLDDLRMKNDERGDSPRLARLVNSIRDHGYDPMTPIIARIGAKGRWVVVDGGHRLTAARRVSHEFWSNLFGARVGDLYFLLFTTPRSFRKMAGRLGLAAEASERIVDREDAAEGPRKFDA